MARESTTTAPARCTVVPRGEGSSDTAPGAVPLRVPLPWPNVNLPHSWHLDPHHITVPHSEWVRAKKIRKRRVILTLEQRTDPAYAIDSPNWDV